jgi:APA family basic amino acid/polyamine antiporter
LNFVFLCTVPVTELAGRLEIGALSAEVIFGPSGGLLASIMICILLVSTISAMVMAGPRVLQVAGVIVLRFTEPDLPRPFRVPAYPLLPAAFVLVTAVILVFVLQSRPFAGGVPGCSPSSPAWH